MKEYTVRITRQAREHLREIKSYISNELLAPDAANRTITVLKKEIMGLSYMPRRIKLTEEEPWRSEGIHRMRGRKGSESTAGTDGVGVTTI